MLIVTVTLSLRAYSRHNDQYMRSATVRYADLLHDHEQWEVEGKAQYDALVRGWEANASRVAAAQNLWEERLYYCSRHDVVFLQGDSRTAAPEDRHQLLGLDDDVHLALLPRRSATTSPSQSLPPALVMARALYEQEHYEEARASLERFTQEFPDSAEAWILLSKTYGALWRREKELTAAHTAVRLRPRDPLALAAQAAALNGNHRVSRGLITAETALAMDSQCIPAYLSVASALALANRHDVALSILDAVLACDPTNVEAFVKKAAVLGDALKAQEAISVAQSAVHARPESPSAHFVLAASYALAGSIHQAVAEIDRARALSPNDFRIYAALGATNLAAGRLSEAVEEYDRALKINPESSSLKRQRDTAQALYAAAPKKSR